MKKSSFRFRAVLCLIIFIAAILYESVNQTDLSNREHNFLFDSAQSLVNGVGLFAEFHCNIVNGISLHFEKQHFQRQLVRIHEKLTERGIVDHNKQFLDVVYRGLIVRCISNSNFPHAKEA